MLSVTLTDSEVMAVGVAGALRQCRAVVNGDSHAHNFKGDGFQIHVDGLGAEMAVARLLDLYYDPFAPQRDRDRGDVRGLHVRSTGHEAGCLIMHRGDPHGVYLLVIGTLPTYRLAGFYRHGGDLGSRWWRAQAPNPAYFIPQSALKPIPMRHANTNT